MTVLQHADVAKRSRQTTGDQHPCQIKRLHDRLPVIEGLAAGDDDDARALDTTPCTAF